MERLWNHYLYLYKRKNSEMFIYQDGQAENPAQTNEEHEEHEEQKPPILIKNMRKKFRNNLEKIFSAGNNEQGWPIIVRNREKNSQIYKKLEELAKAADLQNLGENPTFKGIAALIRGNTEEFLKMTSLQQTAGTGENAETEEKRNSLPDLFRELTKKFVVEKTQGNLKGEDLDAAVQEELDNQLKMLNDKTGFSSAAVRTGKNLAKNAAVGAVLTPLLLFRKTWGALKWVSGKIWGTAWWAAKAPFRASAWPLEKIYRWIAKPAANTAVKTGAYAVKKGEEGVQAVWKSAKKRGRKTLGVKDKAS